MTSRSRTAARHVAVVMDVDRTVADGRPAGLQRRRAAARPCTRNPSYAPVTGGTAPTPSRGWPPRSSAATCASSSPAVEASPEPVAAAPQPSPRRAPPSIPPPGRQPPPPPPRGFPVRRRVAPAHRRALRRFHLATPATAVDPTSRRVDHHPEAPSVRVRATCTTAPARPTPSARTPTPLPRRDQAGFPGACPMGGGRCRRRATSRRCPARSPSYRRAGRGCASAARGRRRRRGARSATTPC